MISTNKVTKYVPIFTRNKKAQTCNHRKNWLYDISEIVPLIKCNIIFGFSCKLRVRYENQTYLLLGRLLPYMHAYMLTLDPKLLCYENSLY